MTAEQVLEALRAAARTAPGAPARWEPGAYADLRALSVLGVVEGYSADEARGRLDVHLPASSPSDLRALVQAVLVERGLRPWGVVYPASGTGWTLRFRGLRDRS